jgi:hypothetical protein
MAKTPLLLPVLGLFFSPQVKKENGFQKTLVRERATIWQALCCPYTSLGGSVRAECRRLPVIHALTCTHHRLKPRPTSSANPASVR